MKVDEFVTEREPTWSELEELSQRAGRHPERLGVDSLRRLGACYRATAADLAVARRRWPTDPVVRRLEHSVARGRAVVYVESGVRGAIVRYLTRGYWRRVRERPGMLAIAGALLVGSTLLVGVWAWRDPIHAAGVVPSQYRGVAQPHRYERAVAESASEESALASEIMTNNIRVTFLAFGSGVLLGIPVIFVLLQNGLLLGGVAGLAMSGGNTAPFIALVVPHGVLELSCIVVASAAGLRIGWAIVAPGHRRRVDALQTEARAAVEMVIGTALWLVVAGAVEGFVTPRRLPVGTAVAVGVTLGGLFWTLVFTLGRDRTDGTALTARGAPSP